MNVLEQKGAKIANSPKAVTSQSEVVFTMLTADAAVEQVILGENGIIDGAYPGLIVIDSSTSLLQQVKKLQKHSIGMMLTC